MFTSLTESLFGSPTSPKVKSTSNITTRGKRTATSTNTNGASGNSNSLLTSKSTSSLTVAEQTKAHELLKNEIKFKDAAITALTAKVLRLEDEIRSANFSKGIKKKAHPISAVSNIINDNGRQRVKVGTRGSLCTQNILEAINEPVKTQAHFLAEKFVNIFQNPLDYIHYLQSSQFATELISVCNAVIELLEEEPRVLFMQSPVYVFGDIHGNLEDLHFFADNIWKLGMDLTAGQFLFLGDYVDRGMSCLECVAYLFGLKILYPQKIQLLRGNHETRDVNGWEAHYKDKSFLYQCKDRFGVEIGESVWEECNQAFDRLPLAAVIDHEIFCIHGGIPRLVDDHTTEVEAILSQPNVISIMPPYDYETDNMRQIATDCIWSDPASEEMEPRLDLDGFGDSPRGGGAVCFGSKAIDNFLERNNLSYIIRAHEAHAHGVSISKGARVFTVFSTSKDHRQGERAMAGCILIDNDKIQVINRSPKYKNKYVHRRTSVTLENLSAKEMEERRRLGLVRFSLAMEDMNNWHQMIAELQDADLSQPVCSSDDEDDEEDAEATREVEAANELNVAENQSHRPNF